VRACQEVVEYDDPADGCVSSARELLDCPDAAVRKNDGISLEESLRANDVLDAAFAEIQSGR